MILSVVLASFLSFCPVFSLHFAFLFLLRFLVLFLSVFVSFDWVFEFEKERNLNFMSKTRDLKVKKLRKRRKKTIQILKQVFQRRETIWRNENFNIISSKSWIRKWKTKTKEENLGSFSTICSRIKDLKRKLCLNFSTRFSFEFFNLSLLLRCYYFSALSVELQLSGLVRFSFVIELPLPLLLVMPQW